MTVVAPATLTVHLSGSRFTTNTTMPQPIIDYHNTNVFMQAKGAGAGNDNWFRPTTGRIQRLVSAVAAQGEVLSLPVPSANSSYISDFYGPALDCSDRNDGVFGIAVNTVRSYRSGLPLFASFVPEGGLSNGSGIIAGLERTLGVHLNESSAIKLPFIDEVSIDTARLYIVVQDEQRQPKLWECRAYNASYTVAFDFGDGDQTAQVRRVDRVNGLAMVNPALSDILNKTSCYGQSGQCRYPELAYLAVLQAFGKLLCGLSVSTDSGEISYSTSIRSTVLAQALAVPGTYVGGDTDGAVIFDDEGAFDANISLKDALGSLVQNITLSLFSLPALL